MQTVPVYYISLSGNTTSFLKDLDYYFQKEYRKRLKYINVKDLIKDGKSVSFEIREPYFAFLPSYLEGGNGVETGYSEILTTPLRQLIAYSKNREYCLGIVGSGNQNFNKQFCLTAYQYAKDFSFPVLDKFELKGTKKDIQRIAEKINIRLA